MVSGTLNKILVLMIGFISVALICKGFYISILFLIFCITLLSCYYGVQINLNNNTYRSYISVLGFRKGKEKLLTQIEYIIVRDAVFKIINQEYGTYSPDDRYEISLVCKGPFKIVLFYSYDKKETLEFAKSLRTKFKSKIEDTTREKIFNLQKA